MCGDLDIVLITLLLSDIGLLLWKYRVGQRTSVEIVSGDYILFVFLIYNSDEGLENICEVLMNLLTVVKESGVSQ